MSTDDPRSAPVPSGDWNQLASAFSQALKGVPDAGAIEQLANQFFTQLPSGESLDGLSLPGGLAPPATPSLPSVPSEGELRKYTTGTIPAAGDVRRYAGGSAVPGESEARRFAGGAGVPTESDLQQLATSATATDQADFDSLSNGFMLPGEGDLRRLFEAGAVPSEADLRKLAEAVAFPEIPDVPGLTDFVTPAAAIPGSFYFLEPSTAAVQTVPQAVPANASTRALPALKLPPGFYDVASVRRDFPILNEQVRGNRIVWLDNGATTQKPQVVIDRLKYFYEHENSNIHRAAHTLAARSTEAYEAARETVRRFLHAGSVEEIVFTRGTTESVNLVAQSWGRQHVREGDEIVISWLEHHSNIVPWQLLCSEKKANLRVAPVDDRGQIILEQYEKLLGPRTRLVAVTHVSNALGTVTPVKEIVEIAHRYGARVLVDGAQAVSHLPVDVMALDCDFYVFSGHKVFAPTGIGVLFGKADALRSMPPWQGGGNMITDVTFERTVYAPVPGRFEAGTGNIADAVGLGAALDYVDRLGRENISRYEHDLLDYMIDQLRTIPGLTIVGTAPEKAGVTSFVLKGLRSEDVGSALDKEGIAVRSGHHCAQPILRRFGYEATVRPSLALYNTCEDVDALIAALRRLVSGRGVLKL